VGPRDIVDEPGGVETSLVAGPGGVGDPPGAVVGHAGVLVRMPADGVRDPGRETPGETRAAADLRHQEQRVGQDRVELDLVDITALLLGVHRRLEGVPTHVDAGDLGRVGGVPEDHAVRSRRLPGRLGEELPALPFSGEVGVGLAAGVVDALQRGEEPKTVAEDWPAESGGVLLAPLAKLVRVVVFARFGETLTPVARIKGPRELIASRLGHQVDDASHGLTELGFISPGLEAHLLDCVDVEDGAPGPGRRVGGIHAVDQVGVVTSSAPENNGIGAPGHKEGHTGGLREHVCVVPVGGADPCFLQELVVPHHVRADLGRVENRHVGRDLDLAGEPLGHEKERHRAHVIGHHPDLARCRDEPPEAGLHRVDADRQQVE